MLSTATGRIGPILHAVAFAACVSAGVALRTAAAETVAAPAYRPLAYPAPVPGSYELPPLGAAADGAVLDHEGQSARLYDARDPDAVTILSFIYTSCRESNGCPMASFVIGRVARSVAADKILSKRTRFVTLSFDPVRDTPEKMTRYAERLRPPAGVSWRFLTTTGPEMLDPILEAYGQAVNHDRDSNGVLTGTLSHVLRVYLVDAQRRIRNIYSSSFLHADTVLADLETVLLEESPQREQDATRQTAGDSAAATTVPRPASALVDRATAKTTGLPPLPKLSEDPLTEPRVALGRLLFFDRRLSRNGTLSCAMCHVPEQGFTSNELATAAGIEGRSVRRNAPSLYNVAYRQMLFHDGRENALEQQVWGPLLADNEMGNPSVGFVIERIRQIPGYVKLFEEAFTGKGPSMETVGAALAAYERTLISGNSPFDRWRYKGETDAISESAQRGFRLFAGEAGCTACHTVGEQTAMFSDGSLHNTGVGYRQSMERPPARQTLELYSGVALEVDTTTLGSAAEAPPSDLGRYEITGDPADRWKYRTPGLRNVELTAPYMHDGSIASLEDVVRFYNAGGVPHDLLAPAMRPLSLDDTEVLDLVAFLESLTGEDVGALIVDATAAPVGDPG